MKFSELPLPEPLQNGLADAGFVDCTPIQERTLPISLSGKDVAGQAQTGTGKTAAFLVTLFTRLLKDSPPEGTHHPRALILAPTRELVVQIEQDAQLLGRQCGLTIQAIYGGVDYMKQRDALREGADVIIGTPGRLIDYLKQKVYSLKQIEMLVIDEADRMFDMGFIADLRFILRRLPPFDKRQNLMFSATLNQRVMELAYEFMNMPEKVSVTPEKMTAENVEQVIYHASRKEKFPLLLGLLRRDGMERTMIFINTKREGEYLHDRLNANGFPCRLISGDVDQKKRLRILEQFKSGELPILIATDVASRGLHIDGVTHVVNYDLPQDCEDYVHRIGRTARAGAQGKAISLADEDGALYLEAIEEYIKAKIPCEWAEDELFVTDFKRVARPKRAPLPSRGKEARPERGKTSSRQKRTPSGKGSETAAAAAPRQQPATSQGAGADEAAPAKKRRRRRKTKPSGEGQEQQPAPEAATTE
ncbi:DEAD/DEAH box helicase [Pelobacter propionicus]|uniref:DEAD/DEAH box helicase domain protein n=1 Tax=Pelobacter propionicus (strain DSM 2379 / NBRC 103807 / OttBd1) TaxID=338966 RepID=A1ANS0_PELPD|nr:DEAD/DEAH box helicase [Pelobacter propionicus]ABK98990.1 DEAD/DEAH box helicase domain protein [Pelobacter propionicus DSM 2379]